MEPTLAFYSKVLAGLLLLTLLTFIQPFVWHLMPLKTASAQLLIAALKIGLVVSYYMHLCSETGYLKAYVSMAVLLLVTFFLIVGTDVLHS